MNKNFVRYLVIWLVLVILFNVVIFAIPSSIDGKTIIQVVQVSSILFKGGNIAGLQESLLDLADYLMYSSDKEIILSKYGGSFWPGYIFIMISFCVNLICAYVAFKSENSKKLFYNIPLITISYSGLITMFVIAVATMMIIDLSPWIGFVACFIVLALNLLSIFKASWAAEAIGGIDDKVAASTSFIKLLTADAQSLAANVKSEELKSACTKLYETIRYSDPVSNPTLSVLEAKITVKMDEFKSLVNADDKEKATALLTELLQLIEERNLKTKALK